MDVLVDLIYQKWPRDVFDDTVLKTLIPGSDAVRYGRLHRALRSGAVLRLKRGVYCLGRPYQRKGVSGFEVSALLDPNSYISFQCALSFHGLVPEAVFRFHAVNRTRARTYKTPVGLFQYTPVPQRNFALGVERHMVSGSPVMIASPLKAVCDLVYHARYDWKEGRKALEGSLRIEADDMGMFLDQRMIDGLMENYLSRRIRRFLKALRKDAEQWT